MMQYNLENHLIEIELNFMDENIIVISWQFYTHINKAYGILVTWRPKN